MEERKKWERKRKRERGKGERGREVQKRAGERESRITRTTARQRLTARKKRTIDRESER